MVIFMAGCSLEKQNGFNRSLQNLTAHYNILFNAKELLRLKQESYASSFVDNYNEILSVYQDTIAHTTTADKDLDAAITKANTIISVKEQSHYLGDAYLVLGKAYYLEGNYFNASEYFSYVVRSFPTRPDLTQDALVWNTRSFIYLNQLPDAKIAVDSAIKNINPKKRISADIYAAKLQYDIDVQDYADGEEMAKLAVKYCHDQMQRLRWTFILSQIQELNQKTGDAFKNYTRISKSNVAFEMAFNASLNRIRIEDNQKGIKTTRIQKLLTLLKDPNNKEFKDQIYYQVAELYLADKEIDNAIKNYKLSVRNSVKNQNQKGLSYLRLAQINFKNKADYISAKKYYDSTLTTLPTNYPGYQAIQKIGSNLQLLADRIQIVTKEDTLQTLARMDEKARLKVIDQMVSDRILQQQAQINSALANSSNNQGPSGSVSGSSFYFYNSIAVSQGYNDFKKKWGNRKLEDNWRRSDRSNSDITNSVSTNVQGGDPDAPAGTAAKGKNSATAGNYRQELIKGLPLTPELLAQSNLRIYNALVDIANFYRDILGDKNEAIAEYELILHRFPNDPNIAAIYYNLYRLYSDVDPPKSDQYKNILIKNYAETPFAKVIIDPDYVKKLGDKDAEFTQAYNQVFDKFARKKYIEVITDVPEILKRYPGNKYSAQLLYLKTIAEGHSEKAIPFADSLQHIAKRFPNDKLITPLINQHLEYISANSVELQNRDIVLADEDPHDIPFTLDPALKKETAFRHPVVIDYNAPKPVVKTPEKQPAKTPLPAKTASVPPPVISKAAPVAQVPPPVKSQPATIPPAVTTTAVVNSPVTQAPTTPALTAVSRAVQTPDTAAVVQTKVKQTDLTSIFTMQDSTNYFFVINVNTGTTNLSSSRFGIGQFDRVNYTGKGIRHELKQIRPDNQLIYVGRFSSLDDVKKYARGIILLLPDIMKVPKDKYTFFIITQENLNKLADKKTLDSYIDYYQKNY